MDLTDLLEKELIGLSSELSSVRIPLIVGGGYGLILKQRHVEKSGEKTIRGFPEARSTNDLDVFLTMEFVSDAVCMESPRTALFDRGFSPVSGAEHYQFERVVSHRGQDRQIKIDLLAAPPRDAGVLKKLKVDSRRTRLRAVKEIHAHTAREAFIVAEKAMTVSFSDASVTNIHVPHPFSFLLLKLFAYRDRRNDSEKDFGRYHAFDLYRIVAMITETEYQEMLAFRDKYFDDEIVTEARRIILELFDTVSSDGTIKMREYAQETGYLVSEADSQEFVNDLKTFFV